MKIAIETFPVRRIRAESASCPMRAPTNDTLPYHKANCQLTAPISEYCSVIADALNNFEERNMLTIEGARRRMHTIKKDAVVVTT